MRAGVTSVYEFQPKDVKLILGHGYTYVDGFDVVKIETAVARNGNVPLGGGHGLLVHRRAHVTRIQGRKKNIRHLLPPRSLRTSAGSQFSGSGSRSQFSGSRSQFSGSGSHLHFYWKTGSR
ncbi:hypothetical protein JTE90_015011 [Oedothorax gibbosus]|uniref:Uncharacterized protein n=1 Tax=Oedothorax gibbosus TaxID=931172 RepID=A0AAV6TWU2_9ARAC|nr:hypothetical protein JTE90_015011 [Oedothorax gibbosus]